jgi:uncharacterized protein YqiB (DUF1249 family)
VAWVPQPRHAGIRLQAPLDLWHQVWMRAARPTVGGLMEVCEDSYTSLMRLAPNLRLARGLLRAGQATGADLYLQVVEQSRYTTMIYLTYAFARNPGDASHCLEPNARLCAYHDARQVEVLDLDQTALPIYRHYACPALDAKWKANLFLAKWLAYCVRQGYQFAPVGPATPNTADICTGGEREPV